MCCIAGTCESCKALSYLRTKLSDGNYGDTIATATFTRIDGRKVILDHVNIDSIGPSAERPGVVGVEFTDDRDRVVHLPFIESWEISYRFV